MKLLYVCVLSICMISCAGLPENIEPVSDFELDKYMGKWYEIARLDHRFERGLDQVTAIYSINDDGTVRVANRGFSSRSNQWEDAVGKAKFVSDSNTGHLEVSFFGPFYGSYIIFELDKDNYQYSFITASKNYLWFLSRTPTVSDELKDRFIRTVQAYGYNVEDLIFVNQE